jgi:hypothetical protein
MKPLLLSGKAKGAVASQETCLEPIHDVAGYAKQHFSDNRAG